MTKLKLHWEILIAMILGIGIGIIFQNSGIDFTKNIFSELLDIKNSIQHGKIHRI